MLLERPGKRPLSAIVNPLIEKTQAVFGSCRLALICVNDPDATLARQDRLLQDLFGLTAAEARLAGQLLEGWDLKTAASRAQVSFNTARTHLAHIFQKTETGRQSELIRVLMASLSGTMSATAMSTSQAGTPFFHPAPSGKEML